LRTATPPATRLNVFSGVGVMAELAVVHERNLVKYDAKVRPIAPHWSAAPSPPASAPRSTPPASAPGSICGVWGTGGRRPQRHPGLRDRRRGPDLAIDTSEAKLELARTFGATDTLKATPRGPDQAAQEAHRRRLDYAFECVGSGDVVAAAYKAIRRGGMAVAVGVAPASASTTIVTRHACRSRRRP